MSDMRQDDIVIVGGGMVGASVALGLAQSGFSVVLVERQPPPALEAVACCETRVSALTRASEHWLRRLGVWEAIAAHSAHPFRAMRVWSDDVPGEAVFRAAEIGEPDLGHVVPNRAIQAALWVVLRTRPAVTLLTGEAPFTWQMTSEGIQWRQGERVGQARLLIGADGAHSAVRQQAAIPLTTREYGQAAIVGCVRTERSHEDTCWQRYTAEGPIAFLSMRDNVSSLAWYVPLSRLSEALSLSGEALSKTLTAASGGRLGRVEAIGPLAGFPLVRRHARTYVKDRVVLVGDAAHTVHPQAGQGVNLGFLDARALVETLSEVRRAGGRWDAMPVLRRYERQRRADNLLVQRAMDGFDGLFARDLPWKRPLRAGVLRLAQSVRPARMLMTAAALYGRTSH